MQGTRRLRSLSLAPICVALLSAAVAQQREVEPNDWPSLASATRINGAMPFLISGALTPPGDIFDFWSCRVVQPGHLRVRRGSSSTGLVSVSFTDGQSSVGVNLLPGETGYVHLGASPGTNVFILVGIGSYPAADYDLTIESNPEFGQPGVLAGGGLSQGDPVLPSQIQGGTGFQPRRMIFITVVTGPLGQPWVDPPAAPGFKYVMTSNARFTAISDFPTGFQNPFTVIAEGTNYGQFLPGQSCIFNGAGVRSFTVQGIFPFDPNSSTAFPLKIAADATYIDFYMEPLRYATPAVALAARGRPPTTPPRKPPIGPRKPLGPT